MHLLAVIFSGFHHTKMTRCNTNLTFGMEELTIVCYARAAYQMRTLYFCPVVSFYLFFLA